MRSAERRSQPGVRAPRLTRLTFMIPLRSSEPHYTRATVTLTIIAVNVAVFLYELSMPNYALNRFIMHYGIVPDRLHYSSILTSMFIHGGFLHIAGNMWFLWIFGRGVEDLVGHAKYLLLYFVCGFAAALPVTSW